MASNYNHHLFKFRPGQVRWKIILWVIVSMTIALLIIFVGILLFPQTTHLKDAPDRVDWSLLEGIMSLVSTALLVGGSIFALREYISNEIQQEAERKKVAFDVYKEIFDRLMSPEDIEARRWIISNIPEQKGDEDTQAWVERVKVIIFQRPQNWEGVPPGHEHLKRVLNTFDFMGFSADYYWPINDELLAWMSAPVAKVWARVGAYVELEAQRRGEPDYYRAARKLGQQCEIWWKTHYPNATTVDGAI